MPPTLRAGRYSNSLCFACDRYLYCDSIQLEADNVLATLYAAKKYIVPHLARACVNYLETSLTAKNACLLLSQSRLFEEPELMQRCWEVIDAQVSGDGVDGENREWIGDGLEAEDELLSVVVMVEEEEEEEVEEQETAM